jgi:hypothetical protein
MEAVCSSSARDMTGAQCCMMATTAAELVNNPGPAMATAEDSTALKHPRRNGKWRK